MKSNLSTSFWKISFLKKNSSFVIAFTHKIKTLKGKDLDKCMKAGHWAAAVIIKKRGCQIPNDFTYNENEN